MKRIKMVLVGLVAMLCLAGISPSVFASYARPQSGLGVYDYAGVDRITVTYLNGSRAKSLANKLASPSSTWSDVRGYLLGFIPYFGPVVGLSDIMNKSEHMKISKEIRSTLKSHSGVLLREDSGEGRGTGGDITRVSGWNGKRSSTKRPSVAATKYLSVVHGMKFKS